MTITAQLFNAKKDPAEKLDYGFDWATELGVDTISTSQWTADAGVTLSGSDSTSTSSEIWVEGGTAGSTYRVINTIVTAAGRTYQRTIMINCVER